MGAESVRLRQRWIGAAWSSELWKPMAFSMVEAVGRAVEAEILVEDFRTSGCGKKSITPMDGLR